MEKFEDALKETKELTDGVDYTKSLLADLILLSKEKMHMNPELGLVINQVLTKNKELESMLEQKQSILNLLKAIADGCESLKVMGEIALALELVHIGHRLKDIDYPKIEDKADTYCYIFKTENVSIYGITRDTDRRQMEHQVRWPQGKLTIMGTLGAKTHKEAYEWLKQQNSENPTE